MSRSTLDNALLNILYKGTTTIQEFNWDNMTTVPMLNLITVDDIEYIRKLITSPRYSGNNKLKMEKMDEVMHYRGFTKFAGGTNRIVYTHPSAPNAVFKVAIDSVGIKDNPAEFVNQRFLKPYCCKVFECSPCGTIASFEKVDRITTFEEFYTIADDYFYLLSRGILGKYVMEDIGIDYFMNVGIRKGFGVVILDFPYLFELDGAKLECSAILDNGQMCRGEIEYDHGFNKLVCGKCGRVYRARDLAKPPKDGGMIVYKKGRERMKIRIMENGVCIKSIDTGIERECLNKNDNKEKVKKPRNDKVIVRIVEVPVEVKDKPVSVVEEKKETVKVDEVIPATRVVSNSTNNDSVTEVINVNLGNRSSANTVINNIKPTENIVKVKITSVGNTEVEPEPIIIEEPTKEEVKPEEDKTEMVEFLDKVIEESTTKEENTEITLEDAFEAQAKEIISSETVTSESAPAEEIDNDEEDGLDDIIFTNRLPLYNKALSNVAYCVPKQGITINCSEYNNQDIYSLDAVDPKIFKIYIKDEEYKTMTRYIINPDSGELEVYHEKEKSNMPNKQTINETETMEKAKVEEVKKDKKESLNDDEIIAKLKASVKKTSLSDIQ